MTDACHIISAGSTLLEALDKLNGLSGGAMTLFAVGEDGRLLGSLTDGDVRRAFLNGADTSSPVSAAMNRACREFDRMFSKNNLMNYCTVHFLFISL